MHLYQVQYTCGYLLVVSLWVSAKPRYSRLAMLDSEREVEAQLVTVENGIEIATDPCLSVSSPPLLDYRLQVL